MEAVGVYRRLSVQQPRRVWRDHWPDVQPVRPGCGILCTLVVVCLGTVRFAAVMTVMMLSLAGIPMTLGFIGKFTCWRSAFSRLWWLVAAVVVGSAIGLYYYLRVAVSSTTRCSNRDATPTNWQYSAGGRGADPAAGAGGSAPAAAADQPCWATPLMGHSRSKTRFTKRVLLSDVMR